MIDSKHQKIQVGVVAELNGKYFGLQYEDSQCRSYGFGPIEKATISDPDFCQQPERLTYKGSPDERELKKATLRTIKKTITWEISE